MLQAVFRKAKALGIVTRIENDKNGQLLLRKYYALPLLPAEMIAGILPALEEDAGLAKVFGDLLKYVKNFWIGRITPERFSVFQQRHRTNNVMESYHRRLNSKVVRHPNVWDLIDTLIDLQETAILEFEQLERGKKVFRVASKNTLFHSLLKQAWDKLADGRFTTEDFMRQAVYFTEGLHSNLHFWDRNTDDTTNFSNFSSIESSPPVQIVTRHDPQPLIPLSSTSASSSQNLLSIKPHCSSCYRKQTTTTQ
ncbi:uncharacterized protein LOC115880139 [Sitophilus oryzae]|uniref:Uncharacterized protein LOC115880139 n=1 Tax=Sitophilus oryzae TaxID=7048 RepID=A0A6J2XP29_SITOR|nr:uncharacterized protein LOC115880139 [Sitophilus oryzae]